MRKSYIVIVPSNFNTYWQFYTYFSLVWLIAVVIRKKHLSVARQPSPSIVSELCTNAQYTFMLIITTSTRGNEGGIKNRFKNKIKLWNKKNCDLRPTRGLKATRIEHICANTPFCASK